METDGLQDRQQRFNYLIAPEHARRIRRDPTLLENTSRFLARLDPSLRSGEGPWPSLITASMGSVVNAIYGRFPAGDYARETALAVRGLRTVAGITSPFRGGHASSTPSINSNASKNR